MSIDEDYYKSIITNTAANNNYIQYESMGDKAKNISVKEYLDKIIPYLSDKINDHKTQGAWRIYSRNTIIKHKTQGEWKIHLTKAVNFISSKEDFDETRTMHTKSNSIAIMVASEADKIIEKLFRSLLQRYQE